MGFLGKLLQFTLLGAILTATIIAAAFPPKPDCPTSCGNIAIPFPFGTNPDCYLDYSFLITCNNTHYSPPRPFLGDGNIQVLNVSLDGEMRVNALVASVCYNQSGFTTSHTSVMLISSNFPVSSTRNKFTVVGCDTYALIGGSTGKNYTTGCISLCDSVYSVEDGSCSGIGCCQTSIPKGVRDFEVNVESYTNHTGVQNFNPCGYGFVAEADTFNFSVSNLMNLQNKTTVPVVLDWAVGNESCKDAKKITSSYACKDVHSECYDSTNGPGYRCNCPSGYRGNPYRIHGCQDVDECKDKKMNKCTKLATCVNKEGNYSCSCPKGYHGNGREDGEGCTSNQTNQAVTKIVAIVVGTIVCTFALLVCSSRLYSEYKKRALRKQFFKQNGGYKLPKELKKRRGPTAIEIYTSEELEKATNSYDREREIHQGGYNTLYEGSLEEVVNNNDGSKEIGQGCFGKIFKRNQGKDTKVKTKVAVKKSKLHALSKAFNQNFDVVVDQFIEEVVVVSQINHKNVVKLLGYCLETENPSLVYPYISNENLFKQINDETKRSNLSWQTRLKIAGQTAEVLCYLHFQITDPIIHGDLKSANILLDIDNSDSIAKVTGFESSSFVVPHQNKSSMRPYQGTPGYCDPELPEKGLTIKSDVYSFGVVLVELLTGKVATSKVGDSLANDFLSSPEVDKDIIKEENTVQLEQVADLAKRCLNSNGANRPTMKDITTELAMIQKGMAISQKKEEFSVVASQPPPHDQFNPVEAVHVHQETVTDVGSSMPSSQELNLKEIKYEK